MTSRLFTNKWNWFSRVYYSKNSKKCQDIINNPEIYLSKSVIETSLDSVDTNTNKLLNALKKKSSIFPLESFTKYKLDNFRSNLLNIITCKNDELNKATTHLICANSKLFRPVFALLVGKIIKHLSNINHLYSETSEKLVQAYELVHVGSLIHDDILDKADSRRKIESTHKKYGTKLAVLAGDVLLSKAAFIVSNLGSIILCNKIAKTLENLIHGELMDIKSDNLSTYLDKYLEKTFLKTASLMAECCSSISIIANSPQWIVDLSYKLGLHIGMAFQIYDDYLDYKSTTDNLGKPTLNDLSQGVVTFPLLSLGQDKFNEVIQLMNACDYDKILDIVNRTRSLEKTKLAVFLHLEQCFEIFDKLSSVDNAQTISAVYALIYKVFTRLSD